MVTEDFTAQEIALLQLLPVNSLLQHMHGARVWHLAHDMNVGQVQVRLLIRDIRRKGVKLRSMDKDAGEWFLTTKQAMDLAPLLNGAA